ncbi:MAG: hypothetical protein WC505_02395 [Patescibacteria group bacterium]
MKIKSLHGNIYIPLLITITLFTSLGTAGLTYVISQNKLTNHEKFREMSFQLAEAGVEYYRWHLAHAQKDFQDGTGALGPYVHDYTDADGNSFGQFTLDITAPRSGSTVVAIASTGSTDLKPNVLKTVNVVLGRPSVTNFAVVANDNMRFGEGTEVFGPIHSNFGLRFDGLAHNVVSSTEISYDDPDSDDCTSGNEWAVHTCLAPPDPTPPTPWPTRTDVFEVGREVDAGNVNFAGMTGNLNEIASEADTSGIYLTDSGDEGYHVHFNTNDTVDIYRVTSQATCLKRVWFWWVNYTSTNLWSIGTEESFIYEGADSVGLNMPSNGLIFIEDHVWVDGQVDGQRVTVIAAEEPYSTGSANVLITDDVLYTTYDGTDAIGLIAQENIYAGFYSEDDLRVDAALIAQNGTAGRPYYPQSSGTFSPANCNQNYTRDAFTNYGAIASNDRYGFAYVGTNYTCPDGHTTASGYCDRDLIYDDEFYFAPPPYFPTTDQYRVITWEQQ